MTNEPIESKGTIAICTPMYGGNASVDYVNTLQRVTELFRENGYATLLNTVSNESLITRARNLLVHNTLKNKDVVGIVFLDADQGVDAEDLLSMVESGKDIIGAVVPMKAINWGMVRNAMLLEKEDLSLYSGHFNVAFLDKEVQVSYTDPIKVRHIGTGVMYVSTKVFEDLKPVCKTYKNNFTNGKNLDEEVVEYFTTSIEEETKELLSEDYNFCKMWRMLGNDVWAATWVQTVHVGMHKYDGSFIHTVEMLSRLDEISKSLSKDAKQ
jgi:hypothetical protein